MMISNLNDCFKYIDNLNLKDKDEFIKLKEDEALSGVHFGLGMFLRNNLRLWESNELTNWFNSKGIFHADDMSNIIITSYHRTKNDKDIKLTEQIDYYKD